LVEVDIVKTKITANSPNPAQRKKFPEIYKASMNTQATASKKRNKINLKIVMINPLPQKNF